MNSNVHLDEYLDFQKYWLVLKRRWIPACFTFATVVGVATVYSLLSPKIYEAEAELLIKSDVSSKLTGLENDLGKIEGLTIDSNPVTTQARILESRPVVEELIEELELRNDDGELLKYEDVTDNLKVKQVVGTDVLQVNYTNETPATAASVVNKLIELYTEADTYNNRFQSSSAKEFIEKQLPQVEANLKEAEANLRNFKNQNRTASLREETTANIDSISSVADRLDQLEATLANVNARYDRLNLQLNMSWQEASAVSALSQSLGVQKTLEQLQGLKVKLTQQRNYLSDNAPQIIALKEEEADLTQLLDRQIADTLGPQQQELIQNVNILSLGELKQAQIAEFANLGLRKAGLEKEIAALRNTRDVYQQKSDALPRLQEQQRELERRVEAAQSTYQNLLSKQQNAQLIEQQNIGNVRRVSDAVIPEDPVGPRKKLIVGGAGVVGIFLGVMLAFLLDLRDRTIKNTREIKRIFPYYPLGGVIPDLNKIVAEKQLLLPNSSMGNLPQFAIESLTLLPVREAYHNIQIDLKLLDKDTAKIIVVTSAVAGEGKSSVCANLAMAEAQCGKRVLLIDGDLRRPTQHYLWEVANNWGLTNILEKEIQWSDAVDKIMPNLDVITSGTTAKHPISLLNSELMKALILSVSGYYDCVIIDAPPLVGLADSKILGKLADGLLFVVRPGVANYGSVEAAKELLTDFKVLGIIANGVDLDREPYGYETYYPDRKYLEAAG